MATMFMAIGAAIAPAAGAVSALSTVSTVLSIGSAFAAIGKGAAERSRLKQEAKFAEIEAQDEELAGAERARDLAREFETLRADQTVVQLANGLDVGVGTPVNIGEATRREATRRIGISRKNTQRRARMARLRSRGLMSESRAAFTGGLLNAGGILVDEFRLTG